MPLKAVCMSPMRVKLNKASPLELATKVPVLLGLLLSVALVVKAGPLLMLKLLSWPIQRGSLVY